MVADQEDTTANAQQSKKDDVFGKKKETDE